MTSQRRLASNWGRPTSAHLGLRANIAEVVAQALRVTDALQRRQLTEDRGRLRLARFQLCPSGGRDAAEIRTMAGCQGEERQG